MIEMVIARYNEPLEWLIKEPFNQIPHTIYNKGSNTNFVTNQYTLAVIPLKNVGRESESYLQHVILKYDNLAKVTLFVPGSLSGNLNKLRKAIFILTHLYPVSTMIGICHQPNLKTDLYDFTLEEWSCRTSSNASKNKESKLTPSEIQPYGKWFEARFGDIDAQYAPYGGVFSIAMEDIIQHPITRYQELIKELQVSSNPEVGHYYERSWSAVFHPLGKNSIYVKAPY
jgi:hypothetical protein